MNRKDAGFTLIEAVIVMAIGSIIICLAVPGYRNAVAATRIGEAQAQLYETLTTVMRHAIVTGVDVVMCPSTDRFNCTATADWSVGWVAYADLDRNRIRGPHEPLVRHNPGLPDGIGMMGSSGRMALVFHANGGNPGSNTTFTFCDVTGSPRAKSVMLANSGRLRQAAATPQATQRCRDGG